MHIDGNFPMILAEPEVQNQRKTKTFVAFDRYLLHVIAKCESVIGPVMFDCLSATGIFEATIDTSAAIADYRAGIKQSHALPERAKAMALAVEFKPEWAVDAHTLALTKLRKALLPCREPTNPGVRI
jgi:hypothetical protein